MIFLIIKTILNNLLSIEYKNKFIYSQIFCESVEEVFEIEAAWKNIRRDFIFLSLHMGDGK